MSNWEKNNESMGAHDDELEGMRQVQSRVESQKNVTPHGFLPISNPSIAGNTTGGTTAGSTPATTTGGTSDAATGGTTATATADNNNAAGGNRGMYGEDAHNSAVNESRTTGNLNQSWVNMQGATWNFNDT